LFDLNWIRLIDIWLIDDDVDDDVILFELDLVWMMMLYCYDY